MGRRVSNGVVGSAGSIGQLSVTANTLSTTQLNTNLIIDPQGTGTTQFVGNAEIRSAGNLKFYNTNNTFYTALQADAASTSSYTIQLPSAAPAVGGYVLSATTGGVCSWIAQTAAGVTLTEDSSTNSTRYILFDDTNPGTGATSSGQTQFYISATKLTFNPNTGELVSTIGTHGTVRGSTSASGQLIVRGTSSTASTTACVTLPETTDSSSTTTGTLVVSGGVGIALKLYAGGDVRFTSSTASSSTSTGALVVTGGAGVGGTLYTTNLVETSSITIKENINPIENALDSIMKLCGVTYDRKDIELHEAGLIAEQVANVLPDMVSYDDNGNANGVKYSKLTAYLVEAIKTIKTELDQLKGI